MARWYNKVEEGGFHPFNVIATTFYEHSEEMLNLYINQFTNASAESFNSKIKSFKAELRGVPDIPFLFWLSKLYA
jgi:transposase